MAAIPLFSKHPPETLFLHELGHVLGLEHPFDNSDGDCIGSTDPWSQRSLILDIHSWPIEIPREM